LRQSPAAQQAKFADDRTQKSGFAVRTTAESAGKVTKISRLSEANTGWTCGDPPKFENTLEWNWND